MPTTTCIVNLFDMHPCQKAKDYDGESEVKRPQVTEHIFTVHGSDQMILLAIMQLHLGGLPFELDPAYSVGTMYEGGVPKPRLKYDLFPGPGVKRADCRSLPLEAGTIRSIAFDPPMQWGCHGTNNPSNTKTRGYSCSTTMNNRFTQFKTFDQLEDLYTGALDEFHRILKRKGVLAFKCMDYTDSRSTMTHVLVYNWAVERNFYARDLFIKVKRDGKVYNPNKVQRHARKEHSYWWIFEKKSTRRAAAL
jgi:hypothetical protein